MRILHLIYDDLNNPWCGGGGAIRTYEIYKRFPKNISITVINGAYPHCKRVEEKDNIKYIRIGFSFNYFLSRLTYSFLAPYYIRKIPHDILIEDFSSHSPIFSFLHTKKPVIGLFQNIFYKYEIKNKKLFKKLQGFLSYIFENIAIKNFKYLIAVSETIKKEIFQINKKAKTFFIPNGVEEFLFNSVPKEENYILFLGRYDIEQKGIDTLIYAYKKLILELKNDLPDLYLVGKGKDENIIKKMIISLNLENKVKILPAVYGKEKKKIIENSLFVCMPSRFESFGMVACEAQACGKPIIASNIEPLNFLVKNNQTGLLFEKDNINQLAEVILKLIQNKDLRKFLGNNGKEWAKQFDWNTIAKKQLECYQQIIVTKDNHKCKNDR
ncbi:MAG: glycosyltransferase family 4 protein [candidate division WOR-3 bacterium]|nr:glycosyltransferase family 4 protein [candidate division WOR-3 bacterium]MDW8113496.1 glycosyltransferase family 4 protein [candidate division WOR-3 bacterium]